MAERIRDIEASQRPRERLLENGPQVLSDAELLAVLLRTGRKGVGAIAQANDLLRECGGPGGLPRLSPRELQQRPGFGPAKAATVAAAIELGCRIARRELDDGERADDPDRAGAFLGRRLRGERQEVVGFLALDARHRVRAVHDVSRGTRQQAPVDCGELLRSAILDGAAGLILYHNHPSGDLEPSRDDLELTKRLAAAGELVGVPLLDHLVVAGTRWLSLRRVHPELFHPSREERASHGPMKGSR